MISDGTMIRGEKNGEAFYILDAFTDKANITVFLLHLNIATKTARSAIAREKPMPMA